MAYTIILQVSLVINCPCCFQHYYSKSPGHPIIPDMLCGFLNDLFDTLDKVVDYRWEYENLPEDVDDR